MSSLAQFDPGTQFQRNNGYLRIRTYRQKALIAHTSSHPQNGMHAHSAINSFQTTNALVSLKMYDSYTVSNLIRVVLVQYSPIWWFLCV